jgi:hypothetical protein
MGVLQLNGNTIGTLPFSGEIISLDPTKSIKFNNLNTINDTDTLYISNPLGKTQIKGNAIIDGSLNVSSITNNLDISGNVSIMGHNYFKIV